ncbi:GPW/gp25 family protein [Actinotalea sp. K2]|uniref:GPW/gp25 family protein n=1 Tax=Actinotalea sp. K2 TaxID=2939438 RepID=UPI002017F67F|nr:GPW/gp25 family protein [Actinotalea sp. K2]MCL3860415.1 GPW/gp25 family protein [Actinotalea sp. K2]
MAEARFLGAGPAFPFQADPGGSLMLRSGTAKIEESIRLVLSTRPGERPMRPTFGCRAHEMVFSPSASPRTLGMVSRAVEEALAMWEPRIDVRGVTAWPDATDPTVLYVEVEYVVRATNDPRNLVHPFYTIPPETGAEIREEEHR